MTNLSQRLSQDIKQATKERNYAKLEVLRYLMASIKNFKIDMGRELSEMDIIKVIQTNAKQVKDSISSFQEGDRKDLVIAEKKKLKILEEYLPDKLSSQELNLIIDNAISEAGAVSSADFGKIMQIIIPKINGRSDGKAVSDLVKQKLSHE